LKKCEKRDSFHVTFVLLIFVRSSTIKGMHIPKFIEKALKNDEVIEV